MRRVLAWTLTTVVLLAAVGVVGIGWYYSGEILDVTEDGPPVYDTAVREVTQDTVVLEDSPATRRPGIWGLDFPEGYAQVDEITGIDDGVERALTPVDGQVEPGRDVRLDGYAFPADPDRAGFDFAVDSIDITAPLGTQPAWYAAGDQDRWAIFVHGRGGGRHECFRLLPVFVDLDWSSLCISYRNDPDTPADPQGIYRQGAAEWEDVEAAVQHALDSGAQDIVLVGYSMGGQVTANFLRRSELASHVRAVVWDAPLLDWGPVIAAAARDREVPQWLVPIGMTASELQARIDYDELNQIANADEFSHPILLFHGTADDTVPVSVSDRFAQARPDLVTYVRVDGAEHVRSWNVERERYEQAVRDFLAEHAGG
jgi:uncharacterized protein